MGSEKLICYTYFKSRIRIYGVYFVGNPMKKLIILICLIIQSSFCFAKDLSIDDQTKELCNKVMINIYQDILKVKEKYKELADFNEDVFYENKYGIYTIMYEFKGAQPEKPSTPYAFAITIDGMEDTTFKQSEGSFNYGFPILGLKFSGYQQKHLLRTRFDILPLIQEHGQLLADFQQKYLSLRLFLKAIKDVYQIKEDIEFEVILKNVSKRHMVVKSLGSESLLFLFNNEYWGTSPFANQRGGENVVLKAGDSISMRFKGESFQRSTEIEIYSVYRMSIRGINPTAKLKIQIVK